MARKTISVDTVRSTANRMLEVSPKDCHGRRLGIIALLESVLTETGNYKGYVYLPSEYLPHNPFINELDDNRLRANYDHTRRVYR